ncbi:hypothetical protein B0H14DRAFT_2558851 [Mycena olivaceomarginata]|nr:hypothetical protein B0H14DRAFT_2558851 [Mycena olivaceomarginata]
MAIPEKLTLKRRGSEKIEGEKPAKKLKNSKNLGTTASKKKLQVTVLFDFTSRAWVRLGFGLGLGLEPRLGANFSKPSSRPKPRSQVTQDSEPYYGSDLGRTPKPGSWVVLGLEPRAATTLLPTISTLRQGQVLSVVDQ